MKKEIKKIQIQRKNKEQKIYLKTWIGTIIITLFFIIASLFQYSQVIKLGKEKQDLGKEVLELSVQNNNLKIEISNIDNLANIKKQALELGMQPPKEIYLIDKKTGQPIKLFQLK